MVKFTTSPSQSKVTMQVKNQKNMTRDRRKSNWQKPTEMTTALKQPRKQRPSQAPQPLSRPSNILRLKQGLPDALKRSFFASSGSFLASANHSANYCSQSTHTTEKETKKRARFWVYGGGRTQSQFFRPVASSEGSGFRLVCSSLHLSPSTLQVSIQLETIIYVSENKTIITITTAIPYTNQPHESTVSL